MLISNLKHIFGGFIEQVMGKKASISQGGQQVAGFFSVCIRKFLQSDSSSTVKLHLLQIPMLLLHF